MNIYLRVIATLQRVCVWKQSMQVQSGVNNDF
jgi:hypothetical protein